jgi:AraC family transcriptional regulator, regulatory protein of adaptative response / methylated-DNA-[protein]-cysteine methyltransferase
MANEKYWEAVLKRDTRFEGRFVYAVRSTGVYCRPTCPSRRPNRSQVLFFARAVSAEQAGFRPCRRCQPRDGVSSQMRLVEAVCRHIERNCSEPIRMAELSETFNSSVSNLHRVFKRALGISVAQYAKAYRIKTFKKTVRNSKDVTSALYEAGFGSSSRLYETSNSDLGMTPNSYRRGGEATQIRYATTSCSLGRLLVAATARGLCAVSLGNSDRELLAALHEEYSDADIRRDNRNLLALVQDILRHLNESIPCPDFAIDIRATAFQRRVWEELRRIPYGTTRSYSDISKSVGKPKATRAVARACGANRLAIVIPCHRVVGKNGELSGYRWGLARKRSLLEKEARSRNRRT